jgi:anthraniloyl-CoA monooxygenase
MIVRISATDWVPDGNTEHDAVEIARAFVAHGADAIDVSSGQVTRDEDPAYGRSYQTPFADRIRHEVAAATGTAVIAVGAIASYDDVNSILLAGRADLCALGRTHLYDPHWTLHAAAEQDYRGAASEWPVQYGPAAASRPPRAPTPYAPASRCCAPTRPERPPALDPAPRAGDGHLSRRRAPLRNPSSEPYAVSPMQ